MIRIKKSSTADTRTCDYAKVDEQTLLDSTLQHRKDVTKGLTFFVDRLVQAAKDHDLDKISDLKSFHADFKTGFKNTTWWDTHKKINRHHFLDELHDDINLVDVMELIVDCVMAGMGRSGEVHPIKVPSEVLQRAFENTVEMLKSEVVVEND